VTELWDLRAKLGEKNTIARSL